MSKLNAETAIATVEEARELMQREHQAHLDQGGECDNFENITVVHSDGDNMFNCDECKIWCKSKNILYTRGRPYVSTDQAKVERWNQVVEEKLRLMLHVAELPLSYWCHAARHLAHVHNMVCTSINEDWAPPCWAVFRRKPDYTGLRVWGAEATVSYTHLRAHET